MKKNISINKPDTKNGVRVGKMTRMLTGNQQFEACVYPALLVVSLRAVQRSEFMDCPVDNQFVPRAGQEVTGKTNK